MKKFLLITLFAINISLTPIILFGQSNTTHKGINYQAVAREKNGKPISNKELTVEIVLINFESETKIYSEEHKVITNKFGLFTLVIGQGIADYGYNFNLIDWTSGSIRVIASIDFGEGLQQVGSVTIQSVPFAFIADSALKAPRQTFKIEELSNVIIDSIKINQVLNWNGINWIPASLISTSKINTENININGRLDLTGKAYISDTLVVESILSSSGMYSSLNVSGDAEINQNLSVGKNLIVSGNISISDTLKTNYFKVNNIEGFLVGKVSDISNHKVTEMQGIIDVGSGKIISDKERFLLNSFPEKIKKDSLKFDERLKLDFNNCLINDSLLQTNLKKETSLLRIADSSIYQKFKKDSLSFQEIFNKERHVRDSSDLYLSGLNKDHQTLLNTIANDINAEKIIRHSQDSAISAIHDSNYLKLNLKLKWEADSRSNSDFLLQNNIQNEHIQNKAIVDSLYSILKNDLFSNYLNDRDISERFSFDSINVRQLIKQYSNLGAIGDSILTEKIQLSAGILNNSVDSVTQVIHLESKERFVNDSILKNKIAFDSISISNRLANEILKRQKDDSTILVFSDSVKNSILQKILDISDSIENEKQERKEYIQELLSKITEDSLIAKYDILEETLSRKAADSLLSNNIAEESFSRDTLSKNIRLEILGENINRQISDKLLSNEIKEDSLNLSLKIDDVKNLNYDKFNSLQDAINIETNDRFISDNNILDSLNSERLIRNSSDYAIKNKIALDSIWLNLGIDNESNIRAKEDDSLLIVLTREIEQRNSNNSILRELLNEEELGRISGDNNLSYRIISDSTRKENSDNFLDTKLNNEIKIRELKENRLEHLIKDNRSLILSGTTLNLTEAFDSLSVDLSSVNTDSQIISYDKAHHILTLSNGGSVDLFSLMNDSDSNSQNELNTNVNLKGTNLEITDAGGIKSVDLASVNTDSQKFIYNPLTHVLMLQNGGEINLSTFLNSSVVLNGSKLEITDGDGIKSIDISSINTDSQQLFLLGNKLSITNGDTIVIPYASNSQSGLLKLSDWNNFNSKPGPYLPVGQVWIGSSNNLASAKTVSGDASLINTGELTISNNAITSSKINNGAVTSEKLNSMGAVSGEVLRFNGSLWQPSIDNSEYTAGSGIAINGNTILNTAEDKIVSLSGNAGIGISGVYPNFLISNTKPNSYHSGDVTGYDFLTISPNSVSTSKIQDKAVNGSKIDPMGALPGQVLKFDGSVWFPAVDSNSNYYPGAGIQILNSYISNTAPDKVVALQGGTGISISGLYPNFFIENILPNAIHTGDVTGESVLVISSNAVTTSKIADNSVTADKLNQMGASSGQVLKFNGVNWSPSNDNNSVYTGSTGINVSGTVITNTLPDQIVNLNGGTGINISGTYPNFSIINSLPNVTHTGDVIGTDSLIIANNAITTSKILNGAVTYSKLDRMGAEEGEVLKWKSTRWVPAVADQTEYAAGDGIKITGTIVENIKPNENHNGDVNGWRTLTIANNAVTNSKILDSAITTSKISFKAITEEKINDEAVSNAKILDASITSNKIMDEAVTRNKLNINSVDSTRIIAGSVSTYNLRHYSINEDKIAPSAVTIDKIKNNSVSSEKIIDNSIITNDLRDEAVTEAKIGSNAVTTPKILDEAVTLTKISKTGAAPGKVIKFIGSNWTVGEDNNNNYVSGSGIQISGLTISNTNPNVNHSGEVTGSDYLTIKDDIIDSTNIKNNSVSNLNIKLGTITGDRLNRMSAINYQVLTFYNGVWEPHNNNSHSHVSSQISDASSSNNYNTLVLRDGSGNFSANVINANLNGNALSASKSAMWSTGRTISLNGGVTGSFSIDGTSDVTFATTVTNNSHNHISSNITDATDMLDYGKIVKRDNNGNFHAKIIYANLDGTATQATNSDNAKRASKSDTSVQLANKLVLNLGNELAGNIGFYGNEGSITLNATVSNATSNNISGAIIRRNPSGDFSAREITASLLGNATSADKWKNSRTLSLTGDLSGSASIDGTNNINILCSILDNSHTHPGSDINDATSDNIAGTIVKRDASGLFSTGSINIGDAATAYNTNLIVFGSTTFLSKNNSSSPLSTIGINQINSDNSSDISPGIDNTGHLGSIKRWKDINVGTVNSTAGNIATLNSTTGTITNLTSINGTITTLSSTTGTINNLNSTTLNIGNPALDYNGNTNFYGLVTITPYKDLSGNPTSFICRRNPTTYRIELIPNISYNVDIGNSSKPFGSIYASSINYDNLNKNSDIRIKENVFPLTNSLENILKLRAVTYDLKPGYRNFQKPEDGKNKIGFIAQEVLKVIPQIVTFDSTSQLYGIKYIDLIPVLTEAIKEQQNIIDSLRTENKANNKKISDMEKRLLEIERRLK